MSIHFAAGTYNIVPIDPAWAVGDEPMGTKNKFWIRSPSDDCFWLFKYPRYNGVIPTGEHWAERIAASLACLLGIPHACVELATVGSEVGSISREFEDLADQHVELVHGNELLSGYIPSYDSNTSRGQNDHTLSNILRCIEAAIPPGGDREHAFRCIGGFVLLDALVLNTDRHHENWALFRRSDREGQVRHWIAPTFDHASSLGRELTEERLQQWNLESERVARYAKKGRGGVFLKPIGRKGENPLVLASIARRRWPEYFEPWLESLRKIAQTTIIEQVDRVPAGVMTSAAKVFSKNLLSFSYGYLLR